MKTGDVTVWPGDSSISEFVFLGSDPNSLLYLNQSNPADDGGVSLYYGDANAIQNAQLVASLPAPLAGLKASLTPSGDIHFLLSGKASSNGSAYNENLVPKPKSSARIYSSLPPRLWVSGQSVPTVGIRGSLSHSLTGSRPRRAPSSAVF